MFAVYKNSLTLLFVLLHISRRLYFLNL